MKKLVDDLRLIYTVLQPLLRGTKGAAGNLRESRCFQTSVSRMLKSGKELGIVRIEVINPQGRTQGILEKLLEQAYWPERSHGRKYRCDYAGNGTVGAATGEYTLAYLARVLHGGDCVGISMGFDLAPGGSGTV